MGTRGNETNEIHHWLNEYQYQGDISPRLSECDNLLKKQGHLSGLSNMYKRVDIGMENKSYMSTCAHLDKFLYLWRSSKRAGRAMVKIQVTAKMHLPKMSFTEFFLGFLYWNIP